MTRPDARERVSRPSTIGLAVVLLLTASAPAFGAEARPDSAPGLCLVLGGPVLADGDLDDAVLEVEASIRQSQDFFPDASLSVVVEDTAVEVATGSEPRPRDRVTILALTGGQDADATTDDVLPAGLGCGELQTDWAASISRALLLEAAERTLARARRPGESGEAAIPSDARTEIEISFRPDEGRITTLLRFNVPVAIFDPGGECWIDDDIGLDTADGWPTASAGHGHRTDPLVGSACDRFRAFMVDGGLGGQALSLLPRRLTFADGSALVLAATTVNVTDDAIHIGGRLDPAP